jgi:hypothetical protein
MRIIVTDGNERAALAACRALVASGHEVHSVAAEAWSLAGVSWRVRPHVLAEDAMRAPRTYAYAIGALARRIGAEILLPVTDAAVEAVLAHRDLLPPELGLPLPSLAQFRLAAHKQAMMPLAREAGLDVPESRALDSPTVPDLEPSWFPAVLKPHRSLAGGQKASVVFVDSEQECRRALAAFSPAVFPVLLQKRVRGPGVGVFLLRWNGETVAAFQHRRLREKPPAGGVSVYRESVALDPALLAVAERLLARLDWQGVAMVECKQDQETGRYVFMELNGRLWGSLQLAVDAGVDFPGLLADCAHARPAGPPPAYREGVRSRWLWGDVDHLYVRMRRSREQLHLLPDAPTRGQVLRDFLHVRWRDREEILRWRDPVPFLVETVQRLGGLLPRRRARQVRVVDAAAGEVSPG